MYVAEEIYFVVKNIRENIDFMLIYISKNLLNYSLEIIALIFFKFP